MRPGSVPENTIVARRYEIAVAPEVPLQRSTPAAQPISGPRLPWQRCRQEGKRVLQAIGGGEARSDMTPKRLAELDHQLEQRMAELRD
jgi:hypothetical protein